MHRRPRRHETDGDPTRLPSCAMASRSGVPAGTAVDAAASVVAWRFVGYLWSRRRRRLLMAPAYPTGVKIAVGVLLALLVGVRSGVSAALDAWDAAVAEPRRGGRG